MQVASRTANQRTALARFLVLCVVAAGALNSHQISTKADTHGNTDTYEYGAAINLP